MRVRGAGLVEQVVAVVPPGDQTEVVERGERGGAGPRDAPDVAAQHLQPRGVARLRALVGGEPDVLAGAEERGQLAVDAVEVAVVGDHDEGAAPRRDGGGRGDGERGRPVLLRRASGKGEPRGRGGLPGGDPAQQRLAGGVCGPGSGFRSGDQGRRGRTRLVQGSLGGGVPLGHGEPQHVAEDAGVAVGDGPGEGQDLGREHRLGADHPADGGQPTGMLGVVAPLDDEPVQVAPGEPHPHPASRLGVVRQLGRNRILEHPVQVRQPGVDDDGRDRQRGRGGRVAGGHARRSSRRGRRASGAPA